MTRSLEAIGGDRQGPRRGIRRSRTLTGRGAKRGLLAGQFSPFFAAMGNASKVARREERKQRSEAERQHRELARRSQRMRNRAFVVAGVIAAIAIVALAITRRQAG